MNLDLLDQESIKDSEKTACDFFKNEDAINKAKELGLPDLNLVQQAIVVGDSDYKTNTNYNRARFIARWGKIGEQLALLLKKHDSNWVFHNQAQPRIENIAKKVQIIFMSGNDAIGIAEQVISASCKKGLMTEKNIKENQSHYSDESKLRTWILYFPSTSHIAYKSSDIPSIPFEISYPTSFVPNEKSKKPSIFPSDHTCRLAFEIDNTRPIKADIDTVLEPSDEIKPDDFGIQLVV